MNDLSPAEYNAPAPMKGGARRRRRTAARGKSGRKMNKKMNMSKRGGTRKMRMSRKVMKK